MRLVTFIFILLLSLAANATSLELTEKASVSIKDGFVTAKIKLEKSTNKHCSSAASWMWGSEQACPIFRIAILEVAFKGKPVFIPYSAFSDLGNPQIITVKISKITNLYLLQIKGGDAADSYQATLNFKADLLTDREVHSSEFPDDALEKTTYKFNY